MSLVERLRDSERLEDLRNCNRSATANEMLEAAECVELLKAALRQMVYETTHLSPEEDDGSHWCKISAEALSNARRALKCGRAA